jgi:protocatechuate 3,4-dioxygenase beta subunit
MMSITNKSMTVLAATLCAVLAIACDDMAMMSGDCFDDLDCGPGKVCDLSNHRCKKVDSLPEIVDFELTPIKGNGTAETQIPNKNLASLLNISDVELLMDTAVRVFGHVDSYEAPGGVPGNLVIERHPQIDNRRLVWNIAVNTSGDFDSDEVTPGLHDVLFKPSIEARASFPQMEIAELDIASGDTGEINLTTALEYPVFPTVEELDGQEKLLLVRGQVLQSQSSPHPVTGIEVEGITDQDLRTSLAVPDEQGYFYLRLPVRRTVEPNGDLIECQPQSLDIIIRPVGDRRLPTVEVQAVELEGPELGVFYMGDEPTPYSLSGTVTDMGGNPIPECWLKFEAENVGNGTFAEDIYADSNGDFSTNLPEGTYRITAIPPLSSGVRMETVTLVLFEKTSNLIIMLRNRYRLTGEVTDSVGGQVADVIVRAKRLSSVSGVDDEVVRTYEGITEANGTFDLPVDSGRYNIYFIPPAASGLPRQLPKRVYVADADESLDVVLPSPAVVKGHIFDQFGEPQCDVTIDVYSSTETAAYLIGQTISDSPDDGCTGAYTVIIPAELADEDEEEQPTD